MLDQPFGCFWLSGTRGQGYSYGGGGGGEWGRGGWAVSLPSHPAGRQEVPAEKLLLPINFTALWAPRTVGSDLNVLSRLEPCGTGNVL